MHGVIKLLLLPFVASALLLMGCGVPIAPEAITATAVAEDASASDMSPISVESGRTVNDTASSLRAAPSASTAEATPSGAPLPLPTLELASIAEPTSEPTPAPDATVIPIDATPEAGLADQEPTPEDAGSDPDPETTAEATPVETLEATATPEPTPTSQPVVAEANLSFASEFLALLNAQRTGRGLNSLTLNATMSAGATEYAGYMGTTNYFGHYPADGSTPPSRLTASGYAGAYNGEALSAGQPTPQIALNALLASAPHAEILLDPTSVEVGIGYAFVLESRYRHYWVVVTGIP